MNKFINETLVIYISKFTNTKVIKALKDGMMFSICDVVLINKIDVMPYFDFDLEQCKKNILMRNPNAKIIPICAKTGEGIEEWADWLKKETAAWKEEEHA